MTATVHDSLLGMRSHPLELIPFFRRFPRSWWRDLTYCFILNIAFGGFFLLFELLYYDPARGNVMSVVWADFVGANCIGYSIHFGFAFTGWLCGDRCQRWSFPVRALYYTAVPASGVLVGYLLAVTLLRLDFGVGLDIVRRNIVSILLLSLIVSLMLCVIFFVRERQTAATAALALARSRAEEVERRALTAHLKMLQAQVEPHFLFNTLANVVGLMEADTGQARAMLIDLIAYLRTSLAMAREDETTLIREAELLRAYLNVLRLRMGPRLAFRIDVPPELGRLRVPPMLLQPLVENAVKHGLEPKIEGGEVAIVARRVGDDLLLRVADTGLGVNATLPAGRRSNGSGLGLANLRERLRALYGERASLQLADGVPVGTEVTVRLPVAS